MSVSRRTKGSILNNGVISLLLCFRRRGSRQYLKPALYIISLLIIDYFQGFWTPAFAETTAEREPLRIVGSSAVFPFAATVAEHFHYKTHALTPLVEAIGTGAGIKLFCSDQKGPDAVMTSRPFTKSEMRKCEENGVAFEEFKLGQDGLVFIQAKREESFPLTLEDLNRALSEKVLERKECALNSYKTWDAIKKNFPVYPIRVLGPAPTSGTYDVLTEKIGGVCGASLRHDGVYIEAPANENLIVQKVMSAADTLGVVTFSFYEQNKDQLHALSIEGVFPSFSSIQKGAYPLSRPLYLYIKTSGMIPTRAAYMREFVSSDAVSYLAEKGLVPLPPEEQKAMQQRAQQLEDIS